MKYGARLALGASIIALSAAGTAQAQDNDETLRQETVTVTGSAIAGTPEDAALPVDVLTAGDLKLEGDPSLTEMIRNLGVSTGVDGQTNQFASNGLEGTSNINLRGLGPGRTLVLLNGKRQTFAPYAIGEQAQLFVDTNTLPSAAIGRIEVLKDGAAAVYGSDAIAGVVNFITRDDLEGFEISGQYETFEGSDGEYDVSLAYGMQGSDWNWVTSAGYQFRSEVGLLDTEFGVPSITENEVGGFSSLSNPGRYVVIGPAGTPIGAEVDSGCVAAGGIIHPTIGDCRFQFTQFDNLVEEEERYQIFSEYNRTFGNGIDLHLEGLYAHTDVPEWKTSPSYPPQSLTNQFVPASHPGYQQYLADNPGSSLAGGIGALFIGRTYGWGGFPGTGGAQEGYRTYDSYRLAGDVKGQFSNGIDWHAALTWHQTEGERVTNDTYINGLTIALQGFGVCGDPNTGAVPAGAVPGQGGCEYYNPFSNAIQASAITGEPNPNYTAGLENSPELAEWMTDGVGTVVTSDIMVFDAGISGQSNVQAQGGAVSYALGAQVRREGYEVDPNEVTDLAQNPGPGGTGPFSFLAGTNAFDENQTIYALFGELQIPLYDDLNVQVATRYEDYGGDVGSTFDPKVAVKWQATDSFALRGSAQTSFKGPTLNQLSGQVTTLQFVAPTLAFKAVDQFGNPNLNPEDAFSFNLGALFDNNNGFTASIDYYNFDFKDPIIVEDQASIVNAAVAALAAGDTDAAILSRITFNDTAGDGFDNNSGSEIARIRTNVVNGPDIQTSGVDLRAEQIWDVGAGEFSLGGEATYIIEYDVSDFEIEGTNIPGGDRVSQFNRSNFSRSLPQWKANFTANYAIGNHNIRGVMRHVDSYEDERGDITPLNNRDDSEIDSQTTFDLFYSWSSEPMGLDLGLSVVNVTDEQPPFVQFDTSYDPYTHNPFGRTFKVSVSKTFGGGR
ncbi:TonB-dependent receptor [Henriciella sp.]|uniref:TonB-dependent receptor domain-containing protein n=1 Tax=Henriciella sp. TaxID=1968823 RepID=UPI002618CF87|nr:TonB-dependent receptor [Henriciella sp.]